MYWSKIRSLFRCWVLRKHSKTSLYSLYLDSLNSVKATMGSINYWLAMKTRFVSEKWKFWYKVLIKWVFLKLLRSWNFNLSKKKSSELFSANIQWKCKLLKRFQNSENSIGYKTLKFSFNVNMESYEFHGESCFHRNINCLIQFTPSKNASLNSSFFSKYFFET